MTKYYFDSEEGEFCHSKKYWESQLEEGEEKVLIEAEIEYGTEYFYCIEFMEVGIKSESCGKQCEMYSPRNGKNGRCKFSAHCYTPTSKTITIK